MLRHSGRRLGDRCHASVTHACAIPNAVGIVNRGAVVIHGKYQSSEVNKSIAITNINRNVHRWFTAIRSIKRRPIRLVASTCLTNIYNDVSLNLIQKQCKSVRKIVFTIKNERKAVGLWGPKSIVIVTLLVCISGPNLVIIAWTGDRLSCRQAQNGINWDY